MPITLKNLSLTFNHKICFEGFSALVPDGAKIAVTGNNGSGKTTLLKAINGLPTPLEGEITAAPGTIISYVPQIVTEHDTLSGGERFNKALSLAIAQNPDVLLLDEPTNHLDISNRKSLMNMLSRFSGTLIVVSHDPQLLRRINVIWHIDNGRVNIFSGNYDDYIREIDSKRNSLSARAAGLEKEKKSMHKKLMQEQERAAKSRQQGESNRKKGKWAPIVAGGKERAAQVTSGSKKAQIFERKDEINAQIKELGLTEEITPSFNLTSNPDGSTVLFIMDGAAGYDGSTVLSEINLTLAGNEKAALIGDNASGKSTLFKAILNPQNRISGTWNAPRPEDIGFLDQHYKNIDGAANALDVISRANPQWAHAQIRKHLNDFLFRKNEEVNAPLTALSGGERARLSLAAIACKVPRLLLLDEITNNIDLQTRRHVEQILINYPGALLVISHDEEFIQTIGARTVYKTESGIFKKSIL